MKSFASWKSLLFYIGVALYTQLPLATPQMTYLPVDPVWDNFIEQNARILDLIQFDIRSIKEHVTKKCGLYVPEDNSVPKDDTAITYSPGRLLSLLGYAVDRLTGWATQLQSEAALRGLPSDSPILMQTLGDTGFTSIDQVLETRDRLKDYCEMFMSVARRLLVFRTWIRKFASVKPQMHRLMLQIYGGGSRTIPRGGFPGVGAAPGTKVVEINRAAREEFSHKLRTTSNMMNAAILKLREAQEWGTQLNLTRNVNNLLFRITPKNSSKREPEETASDIFSLIRVTFLCWKGPITGLWDEFNQLTDAPEFDVSTPWDLMTFKPPEGWEWEEGTENFPGLLRTQYQPGQRWYEVPTEASEGENPPPGPPPHFLTGYINYNVPLDVPNVAANIFSLNNSEALDGYESVVDVESGGL
ncbi:hypothetical protein TWF694_006086 [Orbilia ellipsospora]|uniref:Uncharacterized protein n=1 Tax=Orbilia ellipsospora TaxID=2528407 RepID=A0AAV9WR58_9PEZI